MKADQGDVMPNTLVQFRIEEETRKKAASICEKLGIDFPTYLRMCTSRLIYENGIPFSMNADDIGLKAMKSSQKKAKENGLSEMSLEEINEEIEAYRKEKRKK